MKDLSVAEIVVIIGICVLPVVMGLVLVVVAVCQKSGTSDVMSWSSEVDNDEKTLDVGPRSDKPSPGEDDMTDVESGRGRD